MVSGNMLRAVGAKYLMVRVGPMLYEAVLRRPHAKEMNSPAAQCVGTALSIHSATLPLRRLQIGSQQHSNSSQLLIPVGAPWPNT